MYKTDILKSLFIGRIVRLDSNLAYLQTIKYYIEVLLDKISIGVMTKIGMFFKPYKSLQKNETKTQFYF